MTYILAKCGERELDFSTVGSVEDAVVEVIDSIFEDYDLVGVNVSVEDFEEDGVLTKMFKKANESDYTICLMNFLSLSDERYYNDEYKMWSDQKSVVVQTSDIWPYQTLVAKDKGQIVAIKLELENPAELLDEDEEEDW